MDTNCVMDFGIGLTQLAASVNVRARQTSTQDFTKCLSEAGNAVQNQPSVKTDAKPEMKTTKSADVKADVPVADNAPADNSGNVNQNVIADAEDTFEEADELQATDNEEIKIPDEIMCAMMPVALVTELVSFVAEELGIEPAELEGMIEDMGIDFSGLTDMDNLSQLILKTTGQDDLTVFITDEDFEAKLTDLTEGTHTIVDDFMKELHISEGFTSEEDEEPMNVMELQRSVFAPEVTKTAEDVKPEELPEDVKEDDTESIPISIVKEAEKEQGSAKSDSDDELSSGLKKQATEEVKSAKTEEAGTEKTENPFDAFVQKLTEAAKPEDNMDIEAIRQMREIVYQIVEQIKVSVSKDMTSMEMKLNPENLGRVGLTLTNREGVMTARFVTETQEAKDAISSQMQILIENIEEKGVRVEAVEVTIGNFNFNMNENAGGESASEEQSGRSHRFVDDAELTGSVKSEEVDDAVYMSVSGSTVSYRV